ncbi:YkgJ family cysteine cluster protein [Anaerohalosphaera lusitana]|nr:YkgJ family cysteine cluster protein [Anaerohalosphaera lusitana]
MRSDVVAQVREVYDWLELKLADRKPVCGACGNCCDFAGFDHRLYVTLAELEYFRAAMGPDILEMSEGRCPYQQDSKCSVYDHRFAGCRIFNCRGDENFQSELSEETIRKFKRICRDTGMEYLYMELGAALKLAQE